MLRQPQSMVGTIATTPSRLVHVVVRSVAMRRFGSGTATWPRVVSPGSRSRAMTRPWACISAQTRLRDTRSPSRRSVAHTLRTPHASEPSRPITSRIFVSTTSAVVYRGALGSFTTSPAAAGGAGFSAS